MVPLDSNTALPDPKIEVENVKLQPFPMLRIPTKFTADSKAQNSLQETKKKDGGEAEKVNEGINLKPA